MSLGFYFDGTRCVGCKACQIACKDRFDLQKAGPRPRRVSHYECGVYPNPGLYHLSISCNHCTNPACVSNCPTGAMFKNSEGTVQHNDEKCIGCRMCEMACPYHAPQYNEDERIVIKCDACAALRAAGMNPVCVDACGMRALDFGEIDELKSKHGADLVSELPCLPSASLTGANLLIKAKEVAYDTDFRQVLL